MSLTKYFRGGGHVSLMDILMLIININSKKNQLFLDHMTVSKTCILNENQTVLPLSNVNYTI